MIWNSDYVGAKKTAWQVTVKGTRSKYPLQHPHMRLYQDANISYYWGYLEVAHIFYYSLLSLLFVYILQSLEGTQQSSSACFFFFSSGFLISQTHHAVRYRLQTCCKLHIWSFCPDSHRNVVTAHKAGLVPAQYSFNGITFSGDWGGLAAIWTL